MSKDCCNTSEVVLSPQLSRYHRPVDDYFAHAGDITLFCLFPSQSIAACILFEMNGYKPGSRVSPWWLQPH